MGKRNLSFLSVILALSCGLASTPLLAQSEGQATDAAKKAAPPGDNADFVYTTEYLQQRLEAAGKAPAVYTNEDLADDTAQAPPPAAAFTNDDLKERFGGEGLAGEAAEADEAVADPGAPTDAAPTDASAPAAPPAVPAMTAEERAARIAEIDDELDRLRKRLLAIRNPLLAGTAPPTEDEREAEAGLDNEQRLDRTEAKIAGLKSALDDLQREKEQAE